jgi:hypothetical protein
MVSILSVKRPKTEYDWKWRSHLFLHYHHFKDVTTGNDVFHPFLNFYTRMRVESTSTCNVALNPARTTVAFSQHYFYVAFSPISTYANKQRFSILTNWIFCYRFAKSRFIKKVFCIHLFEDSKFHFLGLSDNSP